MDILIFTLKSVSLFDISNRFWYHMKRSVTKNILTLKDILMITLDSVPLFDISNRFWYHMKRSFTNTKSTHRIFKQHHLHSFDGSKWWTRTSFSYTMTVALKELTKKSLKCCCIKYVKEIKVCWRMHVWSFILLQVMKSMYIWNKQKYFHKWKNMIFSQVKNKSTLFPQLVSDYFGCNLCFLHRCWSHFNFLTPLTSLFLSKTIKWWYTFS